MSADPSSISVLCVDDEPGQVELTATYLERHDEQFTTIAATSPREGFEYLETSKLDCIVSDHNMPSTDGLEFLETVRSDHPELPFILFTGRGSEEIASEAISAGVTDYMQKRAGTEQYAVLAQRVRNAVEHHRARKRRLEADQRSRTILEATPDAVVVHVKGEIVYVNPAAVDLFDADSEAGLLGLSPDELVVSDDPEELQARIEAVLAGEKTVTRASRILRSLDGRTVPVEVTGRRITWDGQPGVVTVMRDVSERQQRTHQLRETAQQLEGVLDSIEAGIWMKDTESRFMLANQQFRDIFDIDDEEEVVGKSNAELFPEEVADQFRANDLRAIDAGEAVETEETVSTPNGERTYLTHVTPLFDEDGEAYATCGVATDITETKRREREFREMSQRLDVALTATETGVWEWNLDTDEVIWNESQERLLGLTPGTFGGTLEAFMEYVHPDDIPAVERAIEEAIEEGGTYSAEFRMRRADGEYVWIKGRGELVTNDRTRRMVGITTDITERKEYERKLRRQNEHLEEFAKLVSHDLRNPLNVAQGRMELAYEEGDVDHLDAARSALERSQTLIEDLLALARDGDHVDEVEAVDLAGIVEECWRNVETADATLVVDTDRHIHADRRRLQQVFENLIRNAVEHGDERVTVTVGDLNDGIYVEDDGPGISAEARERVFEVGYSTEDGGTGFGLNIVEKIVEAHGWEIEVIDDGTGGARFEITGVDTEG